MTKKVIAILTAAVGIFSLMGCQVVPSGLTFQSFEGLYFPSDDETWERVTPDEAGWDGTLLDQALDFAGENRSSAGVILYRGRIMAERYWQVKAEPTLSEGRPNRYYHMQAGSDPAGHPIEDIASAQKSVTSVLVGIAQGKGLLSINDKVEKYLGKQWSKAPQEVETMITVRHLITMTSGLTTKLEYEAPAGTKWLYNGGTYPLVLKLLSIAAKRDINELTREWLADRIGMQHSQWERRTWLPEGRAPSFGFISTARDMSRFGLMILAGGEWNGEAMIDDHEYIQASLRPSQELNPAYGYLWWLNSGSFALRLNRRLNGRLIPSAPVDLVAAQGGLDRRTYIVPSLGLVVTRLGDVPDALGRDAFNEEFWKRLMSAAPASNSAHRSLSDMM